MIPIIFPSLGNESCETHWWDQAGSRILLLVSGVLDTSRFTHEGQTQMHLGSKPRCSRVDYQEAAHSSYHFDLTNFVGFKIDETNRFDRFSISHGAPLMGQLWARVQRLMDASNKLMTQLEGITPHNFHIN